MAPSQSIWPWLISQVPGPIEANGSVKVIVPPITQAAPPTAWAGWTNPTTEVATSAKSKAARLIVRNATQISRGGTSDAPFGGGCGPALTFGSCNGRTEWWSPSPGSPGTPAAPRELAG